MLDLDWSNSALFVKVFPFSFIMVFFSSTPHNQPQFIETVSFALDLATIWCWLHNHCFYIYMFTASCAPYNKYQIAIN
jgi:hypothetical protein